MLRPFWHVLSESGAHLGFFPPRYKSLPPLRRGLHCTAISCSEQGDEGVSCRRRSSSAISGGARPVLRSFPHPLPLAGAPFDPPLPGSDPPLPPRGRVSVKNLHILGTSLGLFISSSLDVIVFLLLLSVFQSCSRLTLPWRTSSSRIRPVFFLSLIRLLACPRQRALLSHFLCLFFLRLDHTKCDTCSIWTLRDVF